MGGLYHREAEEGSGSHRTRRGLLGAESEPVQMRVPCKGPGEWLTSVRLSGSSRQLQSVQLRVSLR